MLASAPCCVGFSAEATTAHMLFHLALCNKPRRFVALRLCLTSRSSSQQFKAHIPWAAGHGVQVKWGMQVTGAGPTTDSSAGQQRFHRGALSCDLCLTCGIWLKFTNPSRSRMSVAGSPRQSLTCRRRKKLLPGAVFLICWLFSLWLFGYLCGKP